MYHNGFQISGNRLQRLLGGPEQRVQNSTILVGKKVTGETWPQPIEPGTIDTGCSGQL
jgi:hypothetical protein